MRHSSDIVLALLLVVVISVLDILIRQLSLTIVLISLRSLLVAIELQLFVAWVTSSIAFERKSGVEEGELVPEAV